MPRTNNVQYHERRQGLESRVRQLEERVKRYEELFDEIWELAVAELGDDYIENPPESIDGERFDKTLHRIANVSAKGLGNVQVASIEV